MDKFLERNNLPRLKQEKIENINRPITGNRIETAIKKLPSNIRPDKMASEANLSNT